MKNFLILFLIALSTVCLGQSTVQLRGDTVKIWKNGGTSELIVQNSTKDSTNGVLTNAGNGRTTFLKFRTSNDSLFLGSIFIGKIGGGDSTVINFDYPSDYIIINGDTIDVNARQWAKDSIEIRKSGDTLFFPNGDTLVVGTADLSGAILNQYAAKENKSAWFERARLDSLSINSTRSDGNFNLNSGSSSITFTPTGQFQLGAYNPSAPEWNLITRTQTDNPFGANRYLLRTLLTLNHPDSQGNRNYGALLGEVAPTSSTNVYYEQAQGVYGYAHAEGNAKVGTLHGVRSIARNDGADTVFNTMSIVVEHGIGSSGTGHIKDAYGVYVKTPVLFGTGNIGSNYQIYTADALPNGYAAYFNRGYIRVRDSIIINGTVPSEKLHINGQMLVQSSANGGYRLNRNDGTPMGSVIVGSTGSSQGLLIQGQASRPVGIRGGGTSNILNILNDAGTAIAGFDVSGRLGLGTTTPNSSAQLDISSTTRGFLPPRMTATQASAISSPAEGLLVYVTDTNGTFTSKGWWGYNGAAWEKLNN